MSTCTKWIDVATLHCANWADVASVDCTDWRDEGTKTCQQWADEGSNQCQSWADEGSNQCQSWADEGHNECCDWWPCSWACDAFYWVSNWVCQGWYWVANWVCQAWYWVANWVCKAWYWVANWVCQAWTWVVKAVCTVWNWITKPVCVLWDNARCAWVSLTRKRKRGQQRIKHVFVLMLENRSFDHVLGFSGITGTNAVTGLPDAIDGIDPANPPTNPDPGPPATTVAASNSSTPLQLTDAEKDPGHEFANTLVSLCGPDIVNDPAISGGADHPQLTTGVYPVPSDDKKNSGFVAAARAEGSAEPDVVMKCFTERQMPVIHALAREFAVCDAWFSSLPGPTWPNRFFAHAASSGGLDDSPDTGETVTAALIDGYRFENGTIYDDFDDACLAWRIFEGDELPQVFAISGMNLNALQGRFIDFEDFKSTINDDGFDSTYNFIEPAYDPFRDYKCGNSMHPLGDVTRGERLIKAVYEDLRNSPLWEKSALVVLFDEHGGFYDHVFPPAATPPGDMTTDEDSNQHGFRFDRLGVRVPAVVISPWIPRNRIDHTVYDHSSVPATLEKLFGLSTLTDRDRAANTFDHLFSLATPRTDAPTQLPNPPPPVSVCEDDSEGELLGSSASGLSRRPNGTSRAPEAPIAADTHGFARIALRRALMKAPSPKRKELIRRFKRLRTEAEGRAFLLEARQVLRAWQVLHQSRNAGAPPR